MPNNIDLIRPLLSWNSDTDEFYTVQIIRRKKDVPSQRKQQISFGRFLINSADSLEKQFPDIITMCDALKARAYFLINRRSHKKVSFRLARLLAERQENQAFNQAGLFLSAIHQTPALERRWVIDLDSPTQETVTQVAEFLVAANVLLAKVPTKTGVHFITAPFFKGDFNRLFPTVAILPDNPTLLYSKEEA